MAHRPGERDFTDLRRAGEKAAGKSRPTTGGDRRWWALEGGQCAGSIQSTVDMLQKAQAVRLRQSAISMRLYGNFAFFGPGAISTARALAQSSAAKDRVTYNAVQSIVDTVVSKVGETKPRPYFLTSGGNYRQQRKAKKLNQYVEGVFYETKTYDVGLDAFRDGAIWGDGFIHVFARGGKIRHERVLQSEIWVDEEEAQYGFPRNMHRVKTVDREELIGYFPDKADVIWRASKSTDANRSDASNLSDMVTVAESWHLGALDENGDTKGGKHAISLPAENAMLVEPEEWPHDFFPFARVPWCRRPIGYWSQGLAEQLQGDQIELNKELWLIQACMHRAGKGIVWLPNGSKVPKESINNDIGTIITGSQKPEFFNPEPISPVYFENTQRIIERMYQKAGVSELSAAGKKPMGLNSGAAQREFEDIQSDRFRTIQRQNDNLYLAVAALDVAISREMGKTDKVRIPGKSGFTEVDFKRDIGGLKDTEFVMQCFPVSRLPRDPSGRLQTIQEYIQAGFITPRQGKRALDFPDIESIESLADAQEDILTKTLDDIVDEGEYRTPEPTDDLSLAKEMVLEYIQRYRLLDLEPAKISLLRTFNSQVERLLQKVTAQTALAAGPMPGAAGPGAPTPQAAPMPQPTSDLVPNQPGIAA